MHFSLTCYIMEADMFLKYIYIYIKVNEYTDTEIVKNIIIIYYY